jgi:glycosyltransferase involved in cell wall biosynthesis
MECFSLSILESLSANVPVITTNVGNEEVIINNKMVYISSKGYYCINKASRSSVMEFKN